MDKFDICIAGAGVIGLAIAFQLGRSPRFRAGNIVLLEQEAGFGRHSSSRNSEVIHAGIHYPGGTLKALLCVRGKALIYEHCRRHGVAHRRLGKYIVAAPGEEAVLDAVRRRGRDNGVDDLEWVEAARLRQQEPALVAAAALLSPSTGIVDSHEFMQSLLSLARQAGVQYAPRTRVRRVARRGDDFQVETTIDTGSGVESYSFRCEAFINSAGLQAQQLASRIEGLNPACIPPLHPCKGQYFSWTGRNPFQRLIYPLPEPNTRGLGIHSVTDLDGRLRFGPDSEYVDEWDYRPDADRAAAFARAIRGYFPAVSAERLAPSYAGVRPKLAKAGARAADFCLQGSMDNGVPGLIQLFGIESPGLTASLAIGERVAAMLQE